ncbi:MAG: hypothetical protein AMS18_00195 [Gemmatimonas sp. SG8_17]|nr:MAG: hypothetical protein AMS18_00195 [Gemmatimonas sp. SG8_17]
MEAKLEIRQQVTVTLDLLEAVLLREILNEENVTANTEASKLAWGIWECLDELLEGKPGEPKNPLLCKAEEYIAEMMNK